MSDIRKEIYLAGGCFWGTEKYLSLVPGVLSTDVGYANGNTENPTYEEVCHKNTGHAECVRVFYNPLQVSLKYLLSLYYEVINPTSINRQGGDTGTQYRTGIYYVEQQDLSIIKASIAELQTHYEKPIAIEVLPLQNYYIAEEYHQKYLDKNPNGYCHIGVDKFELAKQAKEITYSKKSKEELRKILTEEQFEVTQNSKTEPPFLNAYFDNFEEGIYVDVTTGEPLFVSTDKFESGCGWPSFSKPIASSLIEEKMDVSHGMRRVEVRTANSDAHLGHVFEDGPKEQGGLRYCINSASLEFIPLQEMEQRGYGAYKSQLFLSDRKDR